MISATLGQLQSIMFGCAIGAICGLIAGAGADNSKEGHNAKELIVSGIRYIGSCFGAFIGAGIEESIDD